MFSGLFATNGTEKKSFRQVCNSGGKKLDILKIWQFHKVIIISVARYHTIFFYEDIT